MPTVDAVDQRRADEPRQLLRHHSGEPGIAVIRNDRTPDTAQVDRKGRPVLVVLSYDLGRNPDGPDLFQRVPLPVQRDHQPPLVNELVCLRVDREAIDVRDGE